jgi:hypothetical protein
MFWKLIGKILKFYGKKKDKLDFFFLGHYLEGSGELIQIPEDYVISLYCYNYLGKRLFIAKPYKKDQFRAIGKVLLYKTENCNAIFDEYKFYNWCENSDHFGYCNCKLDKWDTEQEIKEIDFTLPFKIEIKYRNINIPGFLCFRICGYKAFKKPSNTLVSITISVYDKFFANKGKPFHFYQIVNKEN